MKRSIWFWIYFGLAILLAVYFITRTIIVCTGHGKLSRVHTISVSADEHNKDLTFIAAAAAVAPNTSAYSINLSDINQRIKSVSGVKDCAVHRRPNGNLAVRVKLYHPVALWTDGKNYFPVSADGTIVKQPVSERTEGNILFRGNLPKNISGITRAANNLVDIIDYLEWVENRRWTIHTKNGIAIFLPEKNPEDAIGSLIILNKDHQILSKNIQVLDMRDSSRILVR